jgi:hypothetical protein
MPGIDDPKVEKMFMRNNQKGLVEALKDPDKIVKSSAAYALITIAGNINNPIKKPIVNALIEAIDDPEIGDLAIEALAASSDDRKEEVLLALISNHHLHRGAAAEALGQLKTTQAVEPLIRLMTDDEASVRQKVVKALRELGDKRAGDVLYYTFTHDPENDIRVSAENALVAIGDQRMIEVKFEEFVSEIVEIYKRGKSTVSFGGFKSMDEGKIIYTGEKFNRLGGIELMKLAYFKFCQYTDWSSAIREDLFKLWVGIGDWGKEK